MAKIFNVEEAIHESPNRNNHDLTHKRHLSGKFGYLYPFCVIAPTVPTDSFEIDTAIGINFMPMWYPTQTRMRFVVHYFSVPYRILWKDWKNTLEGLEDNEMPYHNLPASWFKTGSLADYLGIPTVYVPEQDIDLQIRLNPPRVSFIGFIGGATTGTPRKFKDIFAAQVDVLDDMQLGDSTLVCCKLGLTPVMRLDRDSISLTGKFEGTTDGVKFSLLFFSSDSVLDTYNFNAVKDLKYLGFIDLFNFDESFEFAGFDLLDSQVEKANQFISKGRYVYMALTFSVATSDNLTQFTESPVSFGVPVNAGASIPIDVYSQYCPYHLYGESDTDRVRVRSFAARAYEMIYNSYYRNSQGNQPFVVDGQTKYNTYLQTDASGSDETPYELHQRNWELDAYTSCLPSPQQGNAPVIGITVDGRLRVTHDDGHTTEVQLQDLDGAAGVAVKNTSIDPEHPEDSRTIMSLSSSGLTIADFRSGNALTRFLETSLRTGFRYADFIFGHFGKSPSHQELDMPVFIGGYTQLVDVNKISNVTASAANDAPALGEFAGTAQSFDAAKHSIRHYCDDYGIIMGIMCLVPDAAYSQVLPKHFTYNNRLDFFFPEFAQLGLQPITYEELCPIQSHADYVNGDTSKLLTDTFGYQRPNHDLVWMPDTCHGLFRTELKDSVINRRFGSRPVLGDEFLRIKPEECNSIFSVTEADDDVWTGQVIVKVTAQRPIPRIVIPSLGR